MLFCPVHVFSMHVFPVQRRPAVWTMIWKNDALKGKPHVRLAFARKCMCTLTSHHTFRVTLENNVHIFY